jgi:hypothetical protein
MIPKADHDGMIRTRTLENREQERSAPAVVVRHDEAAYISPSRLARHWGVSITTVRRDIGKGALRASRLPGGQLRISMADARRYGRPIE